MSGKTFHSSVFACVLFGALTLRAAAATNVVVGVNVYDEGVISQAAQDAEIKRLADSGVKTIRTSLSAKSAYFITQAFHHGIGSVVIVYPSYGGTAKPQGRWSRVPLSAANPKEFTAWLTPLLDQLEASGVRLTALELGNELNTSGSNADLPDPGSGRVLGISDLNNPKDAEGHAVAAGYRDYLKIMAALKDLRDHSRLNKATPILSGVSGDWGLPSAKSWDKKLGVSVPDSIEFLRRNGMDKLVDGYAVHVYPSGDPSKTVSARIAELEQKKIFAECGQGAKVCWLTEWGISNSDQSCPINDEKRAQVIQAEREAFQQYVNQEQLAAVIYYTWSGVPGTLDPMSIYRCGAVTVAGKAALSPMPLANPPVKTAPNSEHSLSGTYRSSTEHPRVFTTPADLNDLVRRINTPGSFSAQSFGRLSGQVKADLAAKKDWDATYSGCDLDIYLHAFSYEPTGGYTGEIRSESQLRAVMNVKPSLTPPAGAAIVASRLALYAALVKAGAHTAPGSPPPEQAATLAKRILLAWANRGLRDQKGRFLNSATQFCDGQGHFIHMSENAVGLQIGRGVVYSVHAQDLLQSIVAFDATEVAKVNAFHTAMFNLIHEASNFRFTLPELNHPDTVCELYSNHVAAHLTSLLAIARLMDDGRKFNAVLYGTDRSIPLAIPWTKYFDHAIYGKSDKPIACYKNPGPDSLRSHPSYQTSIVAPGEIEDRYRHEGTLQAFGYPMGVLGALFNMAEIMKNAGIDAYSYRGAHQQSIEMATQYYACYGKYVGFKKIVTADNARACADYQEYVGQLLNDVETPILIGAYRFPGNTAITELDAAAKAESRRDPIETTHFGRWRD